MSRHTNTPELIAQIIAAAGEEAAQIIARAWGGKRVYLRRQILAELVGQTAAERIIGHIGAGRVEVPKWTARHNAARNADIRRRAAGGESCRAIGNAQGLSARQTSRIIAASKDTKDTKEHLMTTTDRHQFRGPNWKLDRRFIQAPDVMDYVELAADVQETLGLELTRRGAQILSEMWNATAPDERARMWDGQRAALAHAQGMRLRRTA